MADRKTLVCGSVRVAVKALFDDNVYLQWYAFTAGTLLMSVAHVF